MTEKANPGPQWKVWLAQARAALRTGLARIHADKTGVLALVVVLLLCLLVTWLFYGILGWPARLLTGLAARTVDGSCAATSDPGSVALWLCGVGLATLSVLGSLAVILVLLLLRGRIRTGLDLLLRPLPKDARFLALPIVTTVLFAMGWSGIEFHFFARPGFILDGLFPAIVGLAVFAASWYATPLRRVLAPALSARDRLGRKARLGIVIGVPVLGAFLLAPALPSPHRDQVVALLGVLVAGFFVSAPSAPASRRRTVGLATAAIALAALTLAMAVPVAALAHCQNPDWFTSDRAACEEAHHNGAMGAWGGLMAAGAAGVGITAARSRDEDEAGTRDVDPCIGLQTRYDELRIRWMQDNDTVQTLDKFIGTREEEYRMRNESAFWGQTVDLAFTGAALGGRLGDQAASQAASVWGRIAQATVETLKPMVVQNLLQQAMAQGGPFDALQAAHALANKASHASFVSEIQEQLKHALTSQRAKELIQSGVKEGSPVFRSAMKSWGTHAGAMADWVGDTVGVAGQATGLVGMFQEYASLKDFSDRIHKLRMRRNDLVAARDELADQLRPAKYDLENCRERISMGLTAQ